jgi:polyisoprenoid-binding protein YceI
MTWKIDPAHSYVGFSVKHMMISTVRGKFHAYSGQLDLDAEDFTKSSVAGEIEVSSIDTSDAQRDEHLRSADFFDLAAFPTIRFRSTGVQRTGDDRYQVLGMLTIRGISQEISLDVEYAGMMTDPWGNKKLGFSAVGVVQRKEFGLVWNAALDKGGVLVGDQVKLELDIQAVLQTAPVPAA